MTPDPPDTDTRTHAFTVRLTDERYEWVRTTAFGRHVKMMQIINEAIDLLREQEDGADRDGRG